MNRINYSNCERVDIGSGKNKREGFIGRDASYVETK